MSQPRHRRLVIALGSLTAAMVGMSFLAVPLYAIFCRATGYDGATKISEQAPAVAGGSNIVVRFDSNVSGGLAWTFLPEQKSVTVRTGEPTTVAYKLQNDTARTTVGLATFNVTPEIAGQYFNKIACFCFTQQTLKPGEARDENVTFYVDPAIEQDEQFAQLGSITLSYTFFPAKTPGATGVKPVAAQEAQPPNTLN